MSYRLPKQTADTDPTTHRAPALKTESQQSRGQCCFSLSVRSTREGNIVYVDIDYESRQPIHTPAYHTSEQSTLQTPDSLCLDPHTTLANTYDDFRVTTYNLRLTHISLVRSPPQVSLSSQYLRLTTYDLRFPSYDLQLTTYDFPALLCWDLLPPTTTSSLSVQSLSAASQPASQHLRRFLPSYDLRLTTS